MNYIYMKKQIEKILKETKQLQSMSSEYERWKMDGAFTNKNAIYAMEQVESIKTACQALEMVLI